MHNNGTQNGKGHNVTDLVATDNQVTFPKSEDTQLRDISSLLHGAPVIQQKSGVSISGKPAHAIATANDFAGVEDSKPFARKVGPKILLGSGLSLLLLLPMAGVFMGGSGGSKNKENVAVDSEKAAAEGSTYVSPEDHAAMQAELEEMRSQQAFINQQVDAEAINAAGHQQQHNERAATAPASTKPANSAAAQPSTIRTSSSPTPARTATPAPRPAPVATAPRTPAPITRTAAREPELVNPFERRAALQALGTYGTSPPVAQSVVAGPASLSKVTNPFETDDYYIQTIDFEQPPARSGTQQAPVRPVTEEERLYQQDADSVLTTGGSTAAPEASVTELPAEVDADTPAQRDIDAAVLDPRGRTAAITANTQSSETVERQPSTTQMAIMPGTTVAAELPYGFNWQEGTDLPEVLIQTTEDIIAGNRTVIPAGTQFLGQAQIDPSSGSVIIQIVGMFGETQDIQIPRSSVVVKAEDGDILTADASGGPSTPGPNVGGFLMEALGNGLSNVIDSDDGLVTDIAGGVAETYIDNQIDRAEASTAARASSSSARPVVWSLGARPVQMSFNNLIPISSTQQ